MEREFCGSRSAEGRAGLDLQAIVFQIAAAVAGDVRRTIRDSCIVRKPNEVSREQEQLKQSTCFISDSKAARCCRIRSLFPYINVHEVI
jgi:hypothetical protein